MKRCGGGVATFVDVNWCRSTFANDFIDYLTSICRQKHLNKYNHFNVTNIYVTPDWMSSTLSTFVDKFIEYPATTLIVLPLIVCGDFSLCDCSFLSSLGHQNEVDFPNCT